MVKKGETSRWKKWLHKYRLVLLDESTFEERFSMALSRLNVFVVIGTTTVTLIIGTLLLVAYTPLREYIPGYASTSLRRSAVELENRTDSLVRHLGYHEAFVQHLRSMIGGEAPDTLGSAMAPPVGWSLENLRISDAESALRENVEAMEAVANRTGEDQVSHPLDHNLVDNDASRKLRHGLLYKCPVGTEVSAIKPGTVVAIEGSSSLGFSVWLQHQDGAMSRYAQLNSPPLHRVGDFVKSGTKLCEVAEPFEYLQDATSPSDSVSTHDIIVEYWLNGRALDLNQLLTR